jgi:DNA polymerase-1
LIPATSAAYKLMMDGSAAFTNMEERGMRIDVGYLDSAIQWCTDKVQYADELLRSDPIYAEWRRRFGANADVSNRNQLGELVYSHLGYEVKKKSGSGRASTDEEAFEHIDEPFVKMWVDAAKLRRTLQTDLIGLREEVDPYGFLHPFFHLHFVRTYRSSSSNINFQNKPNRDQRLAKLVRRAFIPRGPDYELVEADYGALEFRGAANFWKDPKMLAYASDPSLDIHRDMASECYLCTKAQVSKATRSVAKNSFVFPELYGSYWKNIGAGLWDQAERQGLEVDGVPMKQHLATKGITGRDAYRQHIKGVEERFGSRFSVWRDSRDEWWETYLKKGEFPLQTGFVCRGLYSYNNLMNYPIQGPSFHLLLWSLIQLDRWLVANKMKSMVIGQIHDSIMMDLHKREKNAVLNKLQAIMTVDVKRHWRWIQTPLEVEVEASGVSWFDKKEITMFNGEWN